MLGEVFSGWSWPTAAVTALALPILMALGLALRKALIKWSRYAIDGLLYVVGKYITHQVASTLTLRRYAALQLAGPSRQLFVPAREDIALETDRVFIPLTLEGPLGEKRYDHTTLTQCGNRIRVIGEPGSGKSTILKRLLRDECQKSLRHTRSARFPILYELKYLNPPDSIQDDEIDDWFLELLKTDLRKTRVYNMEECIDSYLAHGGVLLLLDGADEINSAVYPRAEQAIRAISACLRKMSDKSIIIVTMRSQFYQQTRHALADEYPHVLEAKPLSPSDIYRFLGVWPFEANAQKHIARIYTDLIDRPTLRDICANPLVLSMYVAEDQLTGHPLVPETRSDFYARVTEELLIRRRAAQVGAPAGAFKLREDREKFLGQLAFEHMLDETQAPNLIHWRDAIKVAREIYGCGEDEAEERVREVALNTGLLSEERPYETLRFIHLTFCEFLAALHSVKGRRAGWQELLESYTAFASERSSIAASRLDQLIPFAAGLAPSYHARHDAISDVHELGNLRLLALVFLETKQYDHPEWIPFCKERTSSLLSELGQTPSEPWLQELHLFAVLRKDFLVNASSSPVLGVVLEELNLDSFFQQLASAGKAALRQILRAYASRDAGAAFRIAALCEFDIVSEFPELIAENCDDPAVLALAIEAAKLETGRIVAWADVLAASALKSEVAAKALSEVSLGDAWRNAVDALEPEARWEAIVGGRSALSDALALSRCRSTAHRRLAEVDFLQACPAPGVLLQERRRRVRMSLFVPLLAILSAAAIAFSTDAVLGKMLGMDDFVFLGTFLPDREAAETLRSTPGLLLVAFPAVIAVMSVFYGGLWLGLVLGRHEELFKLYVAWLKGRSSYAEMVSGRSIKLSTYLMRRIMMYPTAYQLDGLSKQMIRPFRARLLAGRHLRQAWWLLYSARHLQSVGSPAESGRRSSI